MSLQNRRLMFAIAAAFALAAIMWLDAATSVEVSVLAFYLVPVMIAVVGLNLRAGLAFAIGAAVCIFIVRADTDLFAERRGVLLWDSVMAGVTLMVAAVGVYAAKDTVRDLFADERSGFP